MPTSLPPKTPLTDLFKRRRIEEERYLAGAPQRSWIGAAIIAVAVLGLLLLQGNGQ